MFTGLLNLEDDGFFSKKSRPGTLFVCVLSVFFLCVLSFFSIARFLLFCVLSVCFFGILRLLITYAYPPCSLFATLSYGIASMAMVFINKAFVMEYAFSMTLLTL